MKKTILAAVFALTMSMSANAGVWNVVKGLNGQKIPSVQLNIEASGYNLRGYVYDVPQMASVCTSVFASESTGNSSPMQCKTYHEVLEGLKSKEELSRKGFFKLFYK